VGSSGCTFCDVSVFSPAANDSGAPIEQFDRKVRRTGGKYDSFIAYFQPFSNTHCPVRDLMSAAEPFVERKNVVGISIGTRPDCFTQDMYAYLADLAKRTYLCVELGLQSANDNVLKLCNRGHTFSQFEECCRNLDSIKVQVAAHVIIGLPGESGNSETLTARRLAELPVHGVKIHQLMIIRGTAMERIFAQGGVHSLTLQEYAVKAGEFIANMRPNQFVHRIVADTKPGLGLIEPEWSLNKTASVNFINNYLQQNGIFQGMSYKGS
jgi:radical SAM protein (TIGR01212 family)